MENSNVFEITIKVNVVCKDTLEELEVRTDNIPDIIDLLNTELSEDISEWRVEEIQLCEIQDGCAIPIPRTDR